LLALALAPVVALASTFPPVSLRGPGGDRSLTPATVADATAGIAPAAGQLTVDLRELPDAARATIPVDVGVGGLLAQLPQEVDHVADATLGAGELQVGDRLVNGARIDERWDQEGTREGTGELTLELQVGVGHIIVERLPTAAERPR